MRYLKKRIVPLWLVIFLWILACFSLCYSASVTTSRSNATDSPRWSQKKPMVRVTIRVKPKVNQPSRVVDRRHRSGSPSVSQVKTQLPRAHIWSARQVAYIQLNEAIGGPPLLPIQHLMNNGHRSQLKTIICPPRINKVRPPAPPPSIVKTETKEIKIDY